MLLPLATSLLQQLFFRTAIPSVVFSYCRPGVVTLRLKYNRELAESCQFCPVHETKLEINVQKNRNENVENENQTSFR